MILVIPKNKNYMAYKGANYYSNKEVVSPNS